MLGTGNALVTECYNTCFVLEENEKYFMVDGGGGSAILHQLKHAGFNWMDMREIFITHKHIDHLIGIIWMIRMICQNMNSGKDEGEATIYGHAEVISLLHNLVEQLLPKKQSRFIGDRLHLVCVSDAETRTINDRNVTFFDIESTKAKQFGFSMELNSGKKLVCCGDEPYNDCEKPYVEGCEWLLHEAFCLYSELAQKLHVPNLVLYHTEDKNIQNRKELYSAEGESYFSGNLYIPNDLESIEIV